MNQSDNLFDHRVGGDPAVFLCFQLGKLTQKKGKQQGEPIFLFGALTP